MSDRHFKLVEPPVPASNVSEGLPTIPPVGTEYDPRMGVRHVIGGSEHEAHPGETCAALAHAAPEGLDALVNAAHDIYLRLATGGTPTWDEYNALNAALHPFVLSQPDATEEAGR